MSKFPERLCYKSQFGCFAGWGLGPPTKKKEKKNVFTAPMETSLKKKKKHVSKSALKSFKVKRVGGFNAFLGT